MKKGIMPPPTLFGVKCKCGYTETVPDSKVRRCPRCKQEDLYPFPLRRDGPYEGLPGLVKKY